MRSLEPDWPTIEGWLKKITGFDPKVVQPYFQEGQLKKGIHFFLIEYDPGEIIMAKGTTSDFAAVHLQGLVRVLDVVPKTDPERNGCWKTPLLRRLENIILQPPLRTPKFTCGERIEFVAGTAGEFSFSAWAMPPVTYSISKKDGQTGLPAFVKLERDTLVMNAKTSAAGTFTFTITAANATGSAARDVTLTVHPAGTKIDPPPSPGAPGSPFAFLRPLYRAFPSMPLGLINFADFWISPSAGDRVRRHVSGVFGGQSLDTFRMERELSRPTQAARVNDSAIGFTISTRDRDGNELPIEDRFMGITGTLWNQGRSVTLAAYNDGDMKCQMLLIKRKAFQEIIKKCPAFYERKMVEFVNNTLPTILAKNRLFRERFFASDVLDWGRVLTALQGKVYDSPLPQVTKSLPGKLSPQTRSWINKATAETLLPEEKRSLVMQLNALLGQRDLVTPSLLPKLSAAQQSDLILLVNATDNLGRLNDVQMSRLNRLTLESALPGTFASGPTPSPMTRAEFQAFTRSLATKHEKKFGKALQPERVDAKGVAVVKQGDPADAVYLILSGMVRVHMELAGGRTMVNNLETDAFFGEAAILEAAGEGGALPVRKATVETLCASNLIKLDRDVLSAVLSEDRLDTEFEDSRGSIMRYNFSSLAERLRNEHQSFKTSDVQVSSGRILPPHDPPLAIAEQLVLTRNVLLINMKACTRCDQCVRGCAEAHDFLPRFHRANPEMRFGDWEVAGACMNCLDAPCQQVCPVGAITLLDDQAVQIHRDRCVSCEQCFKACPFGVIDMYHPNTAQEAPSMSPKKGTVATKCDLCLTENHDPPCVACCPYDAAKRVDPLEFFPELRQWANIAHR
jgi:Fe-S-cluster-containing hydrogenase component 2/CRP-like cAMP-binding protein